MIFFSLYNNRKKEITDRKKVKKNAKMEKMEKNVEFLQMGICPILETESPEIIVPTLFFGWGPVFYKMNTK